MPREFLEAALAACDRGDDVRGLALLVDAWRRTRAIPIGDAIVALGPRAARAVAAPSGATIAELDAAWRAAAASREPAVLHHLLASAAEGGIARLLELAPEDPRVARAIADALADPQLRRGVFSAIDRHVIDAWRPLTALLVAARDDRALDTLLAAAPIIVARVPPGRRPRAQERIEAIVHAVRDACAGNAPLAPDAYALVDAIVAHATAAPAEAAADASTEAALLADIYLAPDDDGPRSVYADWLNERGRPRGEFIALQLAAAHATTRDADRDARIAALRDTHAAEYLGPLAPHVVAWQFARGFPATCTLAQRAAPELAAWGTVTAIRGGLPATDACPMPALRVANDLTTADFAKLAALADPPPLQALEWCDATEDRSRAAGASYLAVAPRLGHLRVLAWHGRGALELPPAHFGFALHARPLDTLEVTTRLERAAAWFEAVKTSSVGALVLHDRSPRDMGTWMWRETTIRIARGDDGWTIIVEAASGTDAGRLATLLDAIVPVVEAATTIARFTLRVRAAGAWSAANRRRLAAVLDAHPAIAARDVPNLVRRR